MKPVNCVFVMMSLATVVSGQIVIDWTEVPQDIGISFIHNGAENVIVDLETAGGPMAWDFTAQPMGTQYTDALIVPRAATPFGDSFPNANLVLKITEDGYVVYAYGQIAPTFGANLGMGSVTPATTFFRFEPVDTYPVPVIYGATRNYTYGYTLDLGSSLELATYTYGNETVDAYGSVAVPYGTFQCLRTRSFDTTITTMYISGIPVSIDTTTYIIYEFLAEDYGLIAHVLSYPGETDTNFTNANFLERITDFSTGIREGEGERVTHNYLNVSPNPARGVVEIRYIVHDPVSFEGEMRKTKLEIYDVTGRLVKAFDLGSCVVDHASTIRWDGTDQSCRQLGGGVYFVRLGEGENVATSKVMLVR
jgi:hypothetical protein